MVHSNYPLLEIERVLSELSPHFWWLAGADGRLRQCSTSWLHYSGLTLAETARGGWLRLVHRDDQPEAIEACRCWQKTGKDFDAPLRLKKTNGAFRWHRVRFRQTDAPGTWIGVALDIEDQQRNAAALRSSEERFQRLMDSNIIGIAFCNEERVITDANDAYLRTAGRTRAGLRSCPQLRLDEITPPEFAETAEQAFAKVREKGVCEAFEFQHLTPEGNRVPVLAGVASVPGGAMAFALDINEQKRLEEKMRDAAKLESLGLLAGGIAHDFNNLLTGILGNATLALEDAPQGSAQAELLRSVVQAGERAAALTHQMLAYAGKGKFQLECVDVSGLVSQILPLIESSLGKSTMLKLELANMLPSVEADPGQLQQVVMNLAINAAEAIDGSGEVCIRTGCAELSEREQPDSVLFGDPVVHGSHVFLEVRDTGQGMDAHTVQRIFDPFFTTKFTGRGLGLAAVLGIMRGHRGSIQVASVPGRGSTFTTYLPACSRPATYPETRSLSGKSSGSGIVFLVDDEEYVRTTARRTLEAAGYTVFCASNAADAIDLFQALESRVELAILDLTMPGTGGDYVGRRFRHFDPNLKILATSGYPESEVRSRFGECMTGFLPKPFRSDTLRETVHSIISG